MPTNISESQLGIETGYVELIRENNRISKIITWETSDKIIKLSESEIVSRNSQGQVTQWKYTLYDGGVADQLETHTISYSNNQKISETVTISGDWCATILCWRCRYK